MSIASEITRLQTAKADIKTAIEAKGVTVPSSAKLDDYDTYVSQISGGGGTDRLPQLLNNTITSISASDFVNTTEVKPYAFNQCASLSSVTLPNNTTEIGSYAFANCTSLTNLTIPSTVTAIGARAFTKSGITSITFPDNMTGGGFYQESVCRDCKSLTSVHLPEHPTLTNFGLAQYFLAGCDLLTTVVIPNCFHKVDQYALAYNPSLVNVTLPTNANYKTLDMDLFFGDTALVTVTIPNSITTINGSVFSGCTSLTNITIPDAVTIIKGSVFLNCTSLTTVNLPASLTRFNGVDIFKGCTLLTSLNYAGTMAQWNAITKDTNWNRGWSVTTIHCSDGDITV